ncbi:MAG: hypothetical protein IPN59_04555 [Holophaga sp.]|nr:hypothetical protein [Holophaga sp.]
MTWFASLHRSFAFGLILGLLPIPGWGQEGLPMPVLTRDGGPNASYADELRAQIQRLPQAERKAFFRKLRKQQRELKARIQELEFNLEKSESLHKVLQKDGSGLAPQMVNLIKAQGEAIAVYRDMARTMVRERRAGDPQQLDADDLQTDLYAGLQFSSLYRDPEKSTSFFSTSRPFVALDLRQTIRWPGREQWMEFFGTLSFQSSSKETSDAVAVITTSGNFRGEMGAWWMRTLAEGVSWGVIGSVGVVGYSTPDAGEDLQGTKRDEFRNRTRLGVTLRQEEGSLRGSTAEISFVRDPQFIARDRLMVRGKVVLTQFGSQGSSGDFFMEGFVSKGRTGRDEAVLLLGIRLSTLSFLRGLGVGNSR